MKNIFLFLIITSFFACENKGEEGKIYSSLINKKWTIPIHENLWNDDNFNLTIEHILIDSITKNWRNKESDPSYCLHEFIFNSEGKIEYSTVVKNRDSLCGNGLLEINYGKWELIDDILTVELEGGYAMESKFHYKIAYRISFPKESEMKLQKVKNITWDENKSN